MTRDVVCLMAAELLSQRLHVVRATICRPEERSRIGIGRFARCFNSCSQCELMLGWLFEFLASSMIVTHYFACHRCHCLSLLVFFITGFSVFSRVPIAVLNVESCDFSSTCSLAGVLQLYPIIFTYTLAVENKIIIINLNLQIGCVGDFPILGVKFKHHLLLTTVAGVREPFKQT
ncbi:hypothetical protein V1505DRAFT_175045 [Lipomyces doorenjongii]